MWQTQVLLQRLIPWYSQHENSMKPGLAEHRGAWPGYSPQGFQGAAQKSLVLKARVTCPHTGPGPRAQQAAEK